MVWLCPLVDAKVRYSDEDVTSYAYELCRPNDKQHQTSIFLPDNPSRNGVSFWITSSKSIAGTPIKIATERTYMFHINKQVTILLPCQQKHTANALFSAERSSLVPWTTSLFCHWWAHQILRKINNVTPKRMTILCPFHFYNKKCTLGVGGNLDLVVLTKKKNPTHIHIHFG